MNGVEVVGSNPAWCVRIQMSPGTFPVRGLSMVSICMLATAEASDLPSRQGAVTSGGLGSLAQLGEHLPYKQGVAGSSPAGPTTTDEKDDEHDS